MRRSLTFSKKNHVKLTIFIPLLHTGQLLYSNLFAIAHTSAFNGTPQNWTKMTMTVIGNPNPRSGQWLIFEKGRDNLFRSMMQLLMSTTHYQEKIPRTLNLLQEMGADMTSEHIRDEIASVLS